MEAKFDIKEFARTADRIRRMAVKEKRLLDNPDDATLRDLVEKQPGTKKTIYGNLVARSDPSSRAQAFTKNSVDEKFGRTEAELLAQCEQILAKEKLICIDRLVCNNDGENTIVRLIVPEKFAHVAYGGRNLFYPVPGKVRQPDYQVIMFADDEWEKNNSKPLPEKDITIRLAMLKDGRVIKIVRNSNYIGEYKKGVFAAEDWITKTKRGGIFLHAGCREDYLQSSHGEYNTVRTLLVALSANGKTTTTCQILARKGNERSWLVQDDGGALMPDGSFQGFEGGGLFVKTEGVNPGEQKEVYYGLLKPNTLFENVYVTEDNDFDFYNSELTANGRAVIMRRDVMHSSPHIDVDKIDNFVLITRGPLIPAICKLTAKQAVAFMILGQAMESSAGDPTQAGKIRSQFFYDPFVAGNRTEHANQFYGIIQNLPDMNYYLINTGSVGEGERNRQITVAHTMGILDSLLRGGLEDWVDSPCGCQVPAAIRAVDDILVHPERLYSPAEFEEKQKQLNQLRYLAVDMMGDSLHPDIRNVFPKE